MTSQVLLLRWETTCPVVFQGTPALTGFDGSSNSWWIPQQKGIIYDVFFMINGFSGYCQYSYIYIYPMLSIYFQISSQVPGVGTVPSEKVPLWLFVIRSFLALVPREDWTVRTCWDAEGQGSIVRACFRYSCCVATYTLFISFHIYMILFGVFGHGIFYVQQLTWPK